jgi:hypothetical protein
VCIIGGTTALAWPVQSRYQYPALPFLFAGAAVAVVEIVTRLAALRRYGRPQT